MSATAGITPIDVLNATSPQEAAQALAAYLRQTFEADVVVWTPEEARQRGYSNAWSVCWESGPYEWAMISAGESIVAGEIGDYSSRGEFPNGLAGKGWYAEPYNGFILCFFEQ